MNEDANATCYYCGGAVNALNTAHIVKEAEGLLCHPCWRTLENERNADIHPFTLWDKDQLMQAVKRIVDSYAHRNEQDALLE